MKWAGGKSHLLPQLVPFFPKDLEGRRFVEPFMGSAAVFFHVKQTLKPRECVLLDVNEDLVNLFQRVRDDLEDLLPYLQELHGRHNAPGITEAERKVFYYEQRANHNKRGEERGNRLQQAARFLYLNKTCFNGLHRVNKKGEFNVPMGRYKNPNICDTEHLRRASELLQGVTIDVLSFHHCHAHIGHGDFVYLDPPYEPLTRTSSFTAYARHDFTADDQRALNQLLRQVDHRCEWLLSNSTAALIEELYDDPERWPKHDVWAGRSINSAAKKRGKIRELLVKNYRLEEEEMLISPLREREMQVGISP